MKSVFDFTNAILQRIRMGVNLNSIDSYVVHKLANYTKFQPTHPMGMATYSGAVYCHKLNAVLLYSSVRPLKVA